MPDIFIDHTQHKEHPVKTHLMEKPEVSDRKQSDPTTSLEQQLAQRHRISVFSSFVRDPQGVILAEQHEDEHIILFSRRSLVTNMSWIIAAGILLLIPLSFPFLLTPLHLSPDIFNPFTNIILVIFYYLVVCGFALINFATWFYDIDIVTEKRAVDIDFYNISFVSVATARVQDLKDVRFTQKGFLASWSDYGDVTLAVEASGETLVYDDIPHPAEVVSMLSVLIGGHQQ